MNPEIIRKQFRDYVNDDDRFRRFIKGCNRSARDRGYLPFWQEQLWDQFTETFPQYAGLDITAILDVFYVCYVHLTPLHRASIPIRKGLWCVTDAPSNEPNPAPYSLQFSLDSPAWGDATHTDVDHCDECLALLQQGRGHNHR